MSTFKLNNHTKSSLKKTTGLNYDQLVEMSAEEIDKYIQQKLGKRFRIRSKIGQFTNRGSVYLYLNRLIGKKEIERKLSKI
jgi:hypothetical protein